MSKVFRIVIEGEVRGEYDPTSQASLTKAYLDLVRLKNQGEVGNGRYNHILSRLERFGFLLPGEDAEKVRGHVEDVNYLFGIEPYLKVA